jgi:hypothetical protein
VTTLAVDIEIPNGQRLSLGPPMGRPSAETAAAPSRSQWNIGLV